jgi:hypothetical protein
MTTPRTLPSLATLLLLLAACSSTGNGGGTGGSRDAGIGGGTPGSGGTLGTGGLPASGGALASTGGAPGSGGNDAGAWTDSAEHRDAGPTTPDAPVEAHPAADSQAPLVATGIACTDINLSCYERYNYYCTEYTNADDATVTNVEAHCASVEGIFARGPFRARRIADPSVWAIRSEGCRRERARCVRFRSSLGVRTRR